MPLNGGNVESTIPIYHRKRRCLRLCWQQSGSLSPLVSLEACVITISGPAPNPLMRFPNDSLAAFTKTPTGGDHPGYATLGSLVSILGPNSVSAWHSGP
jgi:hypothetical protein